MVNSSLLLICNAWPTTMRYQHHGVGACRACGLPRIDHAFHFLMCPVTKEAFRSTGVVFTFKNGRQAVIRHHGMFDPHADNEVVKTCVINDVFLKTYNALRTGTQVERIGQVMRARLRFWATHRGSSYGHFLRQWISNPALIIPRNMRARRRR